MAVVVRLNSKTQVIIFFCSTEEVLGSNVLHFDLVAFVMSEEEVYGS
jgi:hypothetical protein